MNDNTKVVYAFGSQSNDVVSTRQRLMQEGLRLFSEEGLNAVSLRRLVQAAGAGNPSALHYHFGGREELIAAIVKELGSWLKPRWTKGFDAIEADGSTTPRAVLEALFDPLLEMQLTEGYGTPAIRFIARLAWDFGRRGQELSGDLHSKHLNRAHELLQPVLPDLPGESLKFKLILNLSNVYHGLAERSYLWRSPFGPLDIAEPSRGDELRAIFYDYLEAGLCGDSRLHKPMT
jgi:AcrR family transcriptional regulator